MTTHLIFFVLPAFEFVSVVSLVFGVMLSNPDFYYNEISIGEMPLR